MPFDTQSQGADLTPKSASDDLAPKSGSDALSSALADFRADTKARAAKLDAAGKNLDSELENIDERTSKKIQGLNLTPPKLTPVPTATPQRTPAQAFGSAAGWLAAVGGLLTRRPLVNSMNAMSGVIGAMKKQDIAAAQQQYDIWKVNTENALKLSDFQMQAERDALEEAGSDKRAAIAKYAAVARAMGDEKAASMAELHGIEAVQDLMMKKAEARDKLEKSFYDVQERKAGFDNYVQWYANYQKAHGGQTPPPELKAQKWDEFFKGKRPEQSAAQRQRQDAATQARSVIARLKNGKMVDYGGWTFTPDDLKQIQMAAPMAAFTQLSPKQKALQKVMTDAAAVQYQSADDVAAAYKAGEITRDEAAAIIRENGWAD